MCNKKTILYQIDKENKKTMFTFKFALYSLLLGFLFAIIAGLSIYYQNNYYVFVFFALLSKFVLIFCACLMCKENEL